MGLGSPPWTSAATWSSLELKAAHSAVANVTGLVSAIEDLDLPEGSVDLVVSNYAMHHLRNHDKERRSSARSPGGGVASWSSGT